MLLCFHRHKKVYKNPLNLLRKVTALMYREESIRNVLRRCERLHRSVVDTHFPISGLSVSMSISSSVNGSSGGIPSSGMPLRIRPRNFSRNLRSLNSNPLEAALSTVDSTTIKNFNCKLTNNHLRVYINSLTVSGSRSGGVDQ